MNFYDTLKSDPRFHSIAAIHDPGMLFAPFRTKIESVIADLAKRGQTFQIIETFRSQERQHELFLQHATQLDHVGLHGFGLAVDCARVIGGRIHWESALYQEYGVIAEAEGLTWGGRWTLGDLVHVQYVTVSDQQKIFSGEFYPI